MSKFRILSLDISASCTGWSFLTNNSKNIKYGTIKTDKKLETAERLDFFRKELIKVIKKYKPTLVVLEDTFVGKNPKVNKLLSKFGGVAEQLVYELIDEIPLIISNKTVKSFFSTTKKEKLFIIVSDIIGWKDQEKFTFKEYNDIIDSIAQILYAIDILLKLKNIRLETDYGFRFYW